MFVLKYFRTWMEFELGPPLSQSEQLSLTPPHIHNVVIPILLKSGRGLSAVPCLGLGFRSLLKVFSFSLPPSNPLSLSGTIALLGVN